MRKVLQISWPTTPGPGPPESVGLAWKFGPTFGSARVKSTDQPQYQLRRGPPTPSHAEPHVCACVCLIFDLLCFPISWNLLSRTRSLVALACSKTNFNLTTSQLPHLTSFFRTTDSHLHCSNVAFETRDDSGMSAQDKFEMPWQYSFPPFFT